jgi:hypothetical protein
MELLKESGRGSKTTVKNQIKVKKNETRKL